MFIIQLLITNHKIPKDGIFPISINHECFYIQNMILHILTYDLQQIKKNQSNVYVTSTDTYWCI